MLHFLPTYPERRQRSQYVLYSLSPACISSAESCRCRAASLPPSETLLTTRISSFVMPVASTYSRPFSSLLMRMGADPNFCKICHLSLPLPCFLIACHSHVCISDFTVAVLSFLWVPFYNMGILRKCQECSTMRN